MINSSKFLYEKISLSLMALIEDDFVTEALNFLDSNGKEEKLTNLETITERLEELCNSIMEHQSSSAVFADMSDVKNNIEAMANIDEEINLPINTDDLLVLVKFAEYILAGVEDLESDLENINYSEFSIIENIDNKIDINSFFYHNPTNLDKSILFSWLLNYTTIN
ncbi:hypothetical protein IHC93_19745 [Photobacterium damselae subsp. damselae]|uniref:hypothetical protein n=1 Tax=Photobacterium damselae TaxID=38293 RepID=UPI001F18A60A|nr:hypothetical protein [Photobacterium damselae]UKA27158.1 hypothetical protein IHC93_19745 [Photobacterium damselae subsp. damselae]